MDIVYKKVDELIPYARNNKKHNESQIKKIAKSIREFGFKQPIVIDSKNSIIIGHGRVEGAKLAGLENVPCIVADDLSQEQIKALRIADNKLNESKWDNESLKIELNLLNDNGFDIELTGFDLDFLEIEKKEIAEEEFTEVLGEEHNYLVLYFDNEIDWLQVESLLEIKKVKAFSTRTDGTVNKKMKMVGVGRVYNGAKALEKIRGEQWK